MVCVCGGWGGEVHYMNAIKILTQRRKIYNLGHHVNMTKRFKKLLANKLNRLGEVRGRLRMDCREHSQPADGHTVNMYFCYAKSFWSICLSLTRAFFQLLALCPGKCGFKHDEPLRWILVIFALFTFCFASERVMVEIIQNAINTNKTFLVFEQVKQTLPETFKMFNSLSVKKQLLEKSNIWHSYYLWWQKHMHQTSDNKFWHGLACLTQLKICWIEVEWPPSGCYIILCCLLSFFSFSCCSASNYCLFTDTAPGSD